MNIINKQLDTVWHIGMGCEYHYSLVIVVVNRALMNIIKCSFVFTNLTVNTL